MLHEAGYVQQSLTIQYHVGDKVTILILRQHCFEIFDLIFFIISMVLDSGIKFILKLAKTLELGCFPFGVSPCCVITNSISQIS